MDEVEGGFEVDVDDGVPLLFAHAHHEVVAGDSSVVDKDVYAPEVGDDLCHGLLRLRKICGIGSVRLALHTFRPDLGDNLFGCLVYGKISKRNIRPLGGEPQRNRFSNPSRRTRNQCRFSIKKSHIIQILPLSLRIRRCGRARYSCRSPGRRSAGSSGGAGQACGARTGLPLPAFSPRS